MTAPKPRLDIDATRERLARARLRLCRRALGGLLGEAVRAEIPPMSSSTGCSAPSAPAARSGG